MTTNAYNAFKCIIDSMWTLATSWHLPGLNFTPASFIFFLLFFGVTLRGISDLLASSGIKAFDTDVSKPEKGKR